jgi:hypothetical protein
MPEVARAPGIFGPEIEPEPDAAEQTRFLNYLGRRVCASSTSRQVSIWPRC